MEAGRSAAPEAGRSAADLAEALHRGGRTGGGDADVTQRRERDVDDTPGRGARPAERPAEADRLAGHHPEHRVTTGDGVGVHHPGHRLLVGPDVGRGDVLGRADQRHDLQRRRPRAD